MTHRCKREKDGRGTRDWGGGGGSVGGKGCYFMYKHEVIRLVPVLVYVVIEIEHFSSGPDDTLPEFIPSSAREIM